MRLSGGVCFDKNMSNEDSSFLRSDKDKAEGGISICNEERTYDEEEVGNVNEESDDEEEAGNDEVRNVYEESDDE